MEILRKEFNLKSFIGNIVFNGLVVLDIFLITFALIFEIPEKTIIIIQYFDLIVCLILLGEYALELHKSSEKKEIHIKSIEYHWINCFHTF